MKILQVISALKIGGAEHLLVEMVPLYIKQGIQVDVLLFDGSSSPMKEELTKAGVKVVSLSFGGFIYNPYYIIKLVPYLKGYDIIHTHLTACQYFVAIAKALFRLPIRLVTTEHSTSNRRRKLPFFSFMDRWMYQQYDRIICISSETEVALRKHVQGNIPIQTILNGINFKKFYNALPVSEYKVKPQFIVCMVAFFRAEKDQDTVIRAIKLLPNDVVLWLVGSGPRKNTCEELAKELGIEDRVIFWGYRTDIPSILKAADVVVMSSHWEGFGLAAAEGMAAGKPVIASNVEGLAAIVEGAGLLFNPSDQQDLVSKVLLLKENKALYDKTVVKCLTRARRFSINSSVDEYIKVYNSLCS